VDCDGLGVGLDWKGVVAVGSGVACCVGAAVTDG
jgi:hypothetical protein